MGGVVRMSDIPDVSQRGPMAELIAKSGHLQANKRLCDEMQPGIWKGRRCFVVGGGTSLSGFNFDKLRGELVITVNRGLEACPFSAINVAQDARLWGWYENGDLGQEAKKAFESYRGLKSWIAVQAFPFPEDVYQIGILHPDDFDWKTFDYTAGIPPYGNSGINALMVAMALGASPVYLLGFDMYGKDGRTANYHAGYPEGDTDRVYAGNFIPDFIELAERGKGSGIRVVNLNQQSAVRCFEFGSFADIDPIDRPMIVAFYTKGSGYDEEARILEKSLIRYGLEYYIEELEGAGSWQENVHLKPGFVARCMKRFPERDILYLDADSIVRSYPGLLDRLTGRGDVGVCVINWAKYGKPEWKAQLDGAVLYFKNCPRVRDLVGSWEAQDARLMGEGAEMSDQAALQGILEASRDIKTFYLPDNYCQIFDMMKGAGEPVIEQMQASRRLRNGVRS